MIISDNISVVVQGAISPQFTSNCIKSLRQHLPNAEIILSTWKGSEVGGYDNDTLILNDDPGSYPMSQWEANNSKRQILSTLNGVKAASREYVMKIRSDMMLTSSNFLTYYLKFQKYNEEWHFLKHRIIIPSFITRDPRVWESPMCPSDWCSFGLKEDMLKLWDIPLPTEEEQRWFFNHPMPDIVKRYYEFLQARYNPEQSIWISFVKKFKPKLHSDHMFDVNECSIYETLQSYASNLIIISNEQYGIKFQKTYRDAGDLWHVITYNDFIKIYNKYVGDNYLYCPIDFQRIGLLKFFSSSNKRSYQIAKKNNEVFKFIMREIKYMIPF